MRIACMSDSHDNMTQLFNAVEWCNKQKIDHVLHAGDLVAPFVNRALKNLNMPLTIVFGNNDGERKGLAAMFKDKIFKPPYELELDGKKILMLHEPDPLETIDTSQYDMILHGHLHEINVQEGEPLIINPGELGGWVSGTSSMAVWDTKTNDIEMVYF